MSHAKQPIHDNFWRNRNVSFSNSRFWSNMVALNSCCNHVFHLFHNWSLSWNCQSCRLYSKCTPTFMATLHHIGWKFGWFMNRNGSLQGWPHWSQHWTSVRDPKNMEDFPSSWWHSLCLFVCCGSHRNSGIPFQN